VAVVLDIVVRVTAIVTKDLRTKQTVPVDRTSALAEIVRAQVRKLNFMYPYLVSSGQPPLAHL
jgi:hypothetical protein